MFHVRGRFSVLALAGVVACSSPTDDIDDPEDKQIPTTYDPVTAVITCPKEAFISSTGRAGVICSSENSEGDITGRYWRIINPDGTPLLEVSASGVHAEIMEPGKYTVHLRIEGEEGVAPSTTSQQLEIFPRLNTDWHNRGMILARWPLTDGTYEFFAFNPDTRGTETLSTDPAFGLASWSPSGGHLVFVQYRNRQGGNDIGVLNLETQEKTQISASLNVATDPAWNPKYDILAFTDDSRTPSFGNDEIFLAKLDMDDLAQSTVIAPGGEETNREFYAHFPVWSPDGEDLAVGNSEWVVKGERIRTISIYRNMLTTPRREMVIPEDSLIAFVKRVTGVEYPGIRLGAGQQGVAWSPDGRWIVFNLLAGYMDQGGSNLLVKAAADGSGRLELLADFAGTFTLSPDGNWVYFNNSTSFFNGIPDDVLYRVPLGGGGIVTEVLSGARYPRWYGN